MSGKRFLAGSYRAQFPDLAETAARDPEFDLEEHFRRHGRAEGRHLTRALQAGGELALISGAGHVLAEGWIDDRALRRRIAHPPEYRIFLQMSFYETELPAACLIRMARPDLDLSQGLREPAELGALMLFRLPADIPPGDGLTLIFDAGGRRIPMELPAPARVSETHLAEEYLARFRRLEYGGRHLAGCMAAYAQQGGVLRGLWAAHLAGLGAPALLDFTAAADPPPAFSAITVLYGGLEFLHAHCAALFARLAAAGGEIILVCNSPELATEAAELCRLGRAGHDLPLRLLIMPENAGFAAACNAGAEIARARTLMLVNPDIFAAPATDWQALAERAASLPPRRILGAVLHYADGAVMHAGMRILRDAVARPAPPEPPLFSPLLLRVDHPLKGAPAALHETGVARAVEAVTGSLMLIPRALYRELGGLSEDYVLAYYEDADFCLRARAAGAEVLCDPALRFIHLEGRGSGGDGPGPAMGAMLFNRCLFTERHPQAGQPA